MDLSQCFCTTRVGINNSASVQKALGTITNGIRPVRVHFPAYRGAEFKTVSLTVAASAFIDYEVKLTVPSDHFRF